MEIIINKIFNTGKKYMQVLIALLILLHLSVGYYLITDPTQVNPWVIRIVGFTWILSGLSSGIHWANLCMAKWRKEVDDENRDDIV